MPGVDRRPDVRRPRGRARRRRLAGPVRRDRGGVRAGARGLEGAPRRERRAGSRPQRRPRRGRCRLRGVRRLRRRRAPGRVRADDARDRGQRQRHRERRGAALRRGQNPSVPPAPARRPGDTGGHPRAGDALAAVRHHGVEQDLPARLPPRARSALSRGRVLRGHPAHGAGALPGPLGRPDPGARLLWRERQTAEQSITQRRAESRNLIDRMAAVSSVNEFLERTGEVEGKRLHDIKVLTLDMPLFLDVLHEGDDAFAETLVRVFREYLADVDPAVVAKPAPEAPPGVPPHQPGPYRPARPGSHAAASRPEARGGAHGEFVSSCGCPSSATSPSACRTPSTT